ncbi:hypothetical protein EsDP_00001420 [Epichloe bromicola]|uniref:Uncharacterized protein n=1 Tax=Epichloe bromicola TaxID=79588 RepID=A0ABQ0CHT0_9HYPO
MNTYLSHFHPVSDSAAVVPQPYSLCQPQRPPLPLIDGDYDASVGNWSFGNADSYSLCDPQQLGHVLDVPVPQAAPGHVELGVFHELTTATAQDKHVLKLGTTTCSSSTCAGDMNNFQNQVLTPSEHPPAAFTPSTHERRPRACCDLCQHDLDPSSPSSNVKPILLPDHHDGRGPKRQKCGIDYAIERSHLADNERITGTPENANTSNSTSSQTEILALAMEEPPTRQFRNLFGTAGKAQAALDQFIRLHRKPTKDCSFPSTDESFPTGQDETICCVKQAFDAMCDWSYILEWRATLPRQQRATIVSQLLTSRENPESPSSQQTNNPADEFQPTLAELADVLPPVEEQQKRVLSQVPSDQTMEWISWAIVDAAIQSQQGHTQLPYWCGSDGG